MERTGAYVLPFVKSPSQVCRISMPCNRALRQKQRSGIRMRHSPRGYSGLKPIHSIAAEMATGAPNPAAPSRNAPKENAISKA